MGRFWVAIVAITALGAAASTALAQVQSARVTGGEVRGDVVNGIASFKGIPFAAPPVAENRWRSPHTSHSKLRRAVKVVCQWVI